MTDPMATRIARFVVNEFERLGETEPTPELLALCETLLTNFIVDEQWLWDAPDHADALAALDGLRAMIPGHKRSTAQTLALGIRTALTEQARRIARLEDKCCYMQEQLVLTADALRLARSPEPP